MLSHNIRNWKRIFQFAVEDIGIEEARSNTVITVDYEEDFARQTIYWRVVVRLQDEICFYQSRIADINVWSLL